MPSFRRCLPALDVYTTLSTRPFLVGFEGRAIPPVIRAEGYSPGNVAGKRGPRTDRRRGLGGRRLGYRPLLVGRGHRVGSPARGSRPASRGGERGSGSGDGSMD